MMTSHSSSTVKTSSPTTTLTSLVFDNRNIRLLPVEKETRVFSRQVPNTIFSPSPCTPLLRPRLVAYSLDALNLLVNDAGNVNEEELARYLSGNELLPGSQTTSHAYCGHQFGSFSGQLGDGAAISLGEVINPQNGERWELQLKGAGPTPYSRSSDGRKVLRSSIREFLCSEAMHYLGVPTTRAATCVTSDTTIPRDPFYDGNVVNEKCTVVSRLAPNFFRFGSFEIFKGKDGTGENARIGPSHGNESLKKQLLDHMLLFFPHLVSPTDEVASYRAFYREVVRSTAILVAKWQSVGFVHGVLNTDNMSIMGLTIDYGPFAFMEHFDPDFTPNGSDGSGRYTYVKQPAICRWNLTKFSEVLQPFLPIADSQAILDQEYDVLYQQTYMQLMRGKLGLCQEHKDDSVLVEKLFETMAATYTDFTDTFQALGIYVRGGCRDKDELLRMLVSRCATPQQQIGMLQRKRRIHRLGMHPQQIEVLWQMLQKSPEEVAEMFGGAPIDALKEEIGGEKKKLDMLINIVQMTKKAEQTSVTEMQNAARAKWSTWIDLYHARLQQEEQGGGTPASISPPSPSSDTHTLRVKLMKSHNPTFILRNWVAQETILAAEKEDFSEVRTVLSMLKEPFNPAYNTFLSEGIETYDDNDDNDNGQASASAKVGDTDKADKSDKTDKDTSSTSSTPKWKRYCRTPPEWSSSLLCTCSS